MSDPDWVELASISEIADGAAIEVVAAGRIVAIFCVAGEYYALDGVCPHQGGPLGKGQLSGKIITCPWHGWQFDVASGENQITPTVCQPQIPIEVRGERIVARRRDLEAD